MVSTLMSAKEVLDMVRFVNKAFQSLETFNLGRGCMIKFSSFQSFVPSKVSLTVESALEKFPPSGDAFSELQAIVEQLGHLQGLSCQV